MKEKFKEIMALARSADQKKLSELTELEQHAVMFLGEYFPAIWDKGKIKYNNKAKETSLAYSYVEMNKVLKYLDPNAKGHTSNFYHVIVDTHIDFPEANILEALEKYPNQLLIPFKTGKFDHLPHIQYQNTLEYVRVPQVCASVIAQLVASIKLKEVTQDEARIILVIQRREEEFIKLARIVGQSDNVEIVLGFDPIVEHPKKGSLTYEESNSKVSYLATYLYLSDKGVFLKYSK